MNRPKLLAPKSRRTTTTPPRFINLVKTDPGRPAPLSYPVLIYPTKKDKPTNPVKTDQDQHANPPVPLSQPVVTAPAKTDIPTNTITTDRDRLTKSEKPTELQKFLSLYLRIWPSGGPEPTDQIILPDGRLVPPTYDMKKDIRELIFRGVLQSATHTLLFQQTGLKSEQIPQDWLNNWIRAALEKSTEECLQDECLLELRKKKKKKKKKKNFFFVKTKTKKKSCDYIFSLLTYR
eukprot:TRINITY_DN11189_c0_g1_i1.p1 TRINITY_DN11189_c0_g1~~TRINITY_DN11189_c0_g1_i1.p1  ORF type:complete len:244 (-),score=46.36 TRINITY_DN11189_c0_g1_i1:60-761(-)